MDALALAHQIVELCKQSGLDEGRVDVALKLADQLLTDQMLAEENAYLAELEARHQGPPPPPSPDEDPRTRVRP